MDEVALRNDTLVYKHIRSTSNSISPKSASRRPSRTNTREHGNSATGQWIASYVTSTPRLVDPRISGTDDTRYPANRLGTVAAHDRANSLVSSTL